MLEEGQNLPASFFVTVTEGMVKRYARVSGDYSKIHLCSKAAKHAGFPDKIVHGMLTMGICTRLFSPYLQDNGIITSLEARFTAPLLVGDRLHVHGKIIRKKENELTFAFNGETHQEIIQGVCIISFF